MAKLFFLKRKKKTKKKYKKFLVASITSKHCNKIKYEYKTGNRRKKSEIKQQQQQQHSQLF